jgi:periplasmic glucans biosynthesis protein
MASRRQVLSALALSPLAGLLTWLHPLAAYAGPLLDEPRPFSPEQVRQRAKTLAQSEYVPPVSKLPKELAGLSYEQYRRIHFLPEQSIWRGDGLLFQLQLYHMGSYYDVPVRIHLVEGGLSRRLLYAPEYFSFPPELKLPPLAELDFSGFRIHFPLNRPDHSDEFAVFQGASYFRAVGRNQGYGLSARGLALNTAEPTGEEFPIFRSFWIERPNPGAGAIVVHALLDSKSTTGAYRFVIRPGEETEMEVEVALYPRVEIAKSGIAPLTSMYLFGPADHAGVDDYRPAVHDSGGLAIWNGRGERLWRPLTNPTRLQVSQFLDQGPRGFGLLQRRRKFDAFQDIEARYEQRPSLWVVPVGDWGKGAIHLIEIPSTEEIHDNIVAYWRPAEPLDAGGEYLLSYRLYWCSAPPTDPDIAIVSGTYVGAGRRANSRFYAIDFVGEPLRQTVADKPVEKDITTSPGSVLSSDLQDLPGGGLRLSFTLDPGDAKAVELRCFLKRGGEPISEVWLSRWTA